MQMLVRVAVFVVFAFSALGTAAGACVDNVVLVHGNSGYPDDFDNTYVELRARGYTDAQIWRPSWGSKTCPACNDHSGTEETPVANALTAAIAASCTGKIDVIGHSMGVTLLAREITKLNLSSKVNTFVGIAGAYRGLLSCGVYPFNAATSTCGAQGLSVGSPLLNGIYAKPLAAKTYSIKSWSDEIVCSMGSCLVYGVHSSSIAGETASYTYAYFHYQLLWFTSILQADLIQ